MILATLLGAIRDELAATVTAVGGRVYVAMDTAADLRPTDGTQLPYLVVAPGEATLDWRPGKVANVRYPIRVTAYVRNHRGVEDPLLGNTTYGETGLISLAQSVVGCLAMHHLAARVAGVELAVPDGVSEPAYLAGEAWWAVTQTVRMRYEMTETV